MDLATIQALLDNKGGRKKKSSTGVAWVRLPDGTLDKVELSVIGSPGHYEGKQGTSKRSRKGAARIQPNGSRFYCPNYDHEVVSYTNGR